MQNSVSFFKSTEDGCISHPDMMLSHHQKKPPKITMRKPDTLFKFLAHRYCHRITVRIFGEGLQSYDLSWKICRTTRLEQDLPHDCFLCSVGRFQLPPQLPATVPPHNKMKQHTASATKSLKNTKQFQLLILTKHILKHPYNSSSIYSKIWVFFSKGNCAKVEFNLKHLFPHRIWLSWLHVTHQVMPETAKSTLRALKKENMLAAIYQCSSMNFPFLLSASERQVKTANLKINK